MGINEIGVVGLGRMGGGLADLAISKGYHVVGLTLGGAPRELVEAGLVEVSDIAGFREKLQPRRVVLLYIPAGPDVDAALDKLASSLEPGDIVVDGGNSYWGDSIRRHDRLKARGIDFVDLGTSGGLSGARTGACFMAGGDKDVVATIEPLLKSLSVPDGFVHAGPPGSGHFVKLVHNGIEFGMLQAIGEGFDLLTRFHEPLDLDGVLECWRNGSVIRSWLIDLLAEAHSDDPTLSKTTRYIEDTGEVNWLVADALRMEAPIPVISQSVMQLFASRDENGVWAKAIVAMRHGFGGHPFGPNASVVAERREGRVGDIYRPKTV
ncbi:NADP(+)-dependent, decarboxylating phosphogluconate dehydrogenase [Devosia nitrariae]|uniref:6-phosphogluconate dehydrogenase n=1 Tax=Devosia nitrariae TaxID=2071872 RepID=A0ABQ5W1N8_9HYPH|nr:NADP-dependent phosphogluconate dehydrogenase [Devosia nitrariae]GLQ53975.1 6-phosphogluconate dehydrogenase [Devosia nitrariae]